MSFRHVFHDSILREYDIRGIVGETVGENDAYAIGRAFATIALSQGGRKIAVGYDGRLSSPDLEAAIVRGLTEGGIDVVRVGLGPTPMLYFAVHHLDTDGGIQITGSHNPPTHNGFKMMMGKTSFFGDSIQTLGELAESGELSSGEGTATVCDIREDYVARVVADYAGERAMNIVWDAGNGAAGEVMSMITSRLPGQHTLMFEDIDGNFPNHHPDPTVPENLQDLIAKVSETGAEAGIAFDGDGDRIGVVDGQGRILFGDQLMQILAEDMLKKHPGAPIICDVKASETFFDRVRSLGGQPVMWKTGHSLIKSAMVDHKAPLAGEMSGHIFYKDNFYGHDDALYVAIRLLSILGRGDRTMADFRDAMVPVVNTPEIRFDCPDDQKFDVVEQIAVSLESDGADVDQIDGVRVKTDDGWWLIRASNTQAVLVARAEAKDDEGLGRLKDQISGRLRAAGVEPPPF